MPADAGQRSQRLRRGPFACGVSLPPGPLSRTPLHHKRLNAASPDCLEYLPDIHRPESPPAPLDVEHEVVRLLNADYRLPQERLKAVRGPDMVKNELGRLFILTCDVRY